VNTGRGMDMLACAYRCTWTDPDVVGVFVQAARDSDDVKSPGHVWSRYDAKVGLFRSAIVNPRIHTLTHSI
jgi:hypothetical protein